MRSLSGILGPPPKPPGEPRTYETVSALLTAAL
ncbi:hypothetical protein BH20CHL7_BH20CHL7_16710 [soil metagenome]